MFEVLLGAVSGLIYAAGVYLWIERKGHQAENIPVDEIVERIDMIEGKLTLVLERIEDAMNEIEPPSVAEHITGAFSAWFQNKMLRDQVDMMGATILEPPHQQSESWPDVEPAENAPDEVPSP
jgi:hypothetical protein